MLVCMNFLQAQGAQGAYIDKFAYDIVLCFILDT